jgi:hypothetical protein
MDLYDNLSDWAFSEQTISNFDIFHFRLRLISIFFATSITKNSWIWGISALSLSKNIIKSVSW